MVLQSGALCRSLVHRKVANELRFLYNGSSSRFTFRNNYSDCLKKDQSCYDVAVVGGGIVGMATARELIQRHPALTFVVLEKESELAYHQSRHNSGVVHAGIYYKPGSLRARLCVEGLKLMYNYCDEHAIPYKKCGKLIVAVNEDEVGGLDDLYDRALQNNVPDLRLVDACGIRDIEPNCVGVKAIHSPQTGIIDYALVTQSYAADFVSLGGNIQTRYKVTDIREGQGVDYPIEVVNEGRNESGTVRCKYLVTCGGLYSDVLAKMSGCSQDPKIVPFRGDYLQIKPGKENLVNGNIYPVPDPKLPFLGVHFTPRMDGSVWLGPNAVLAFRREGYSFKDVNVRELLDALMYRGVQKLVFKHLKTGLGEMYRMAWRQAQVRQLQKFVPSLTLQDVTKGPSGVRAQALDLEGNLVEDFITDSGTGTLASRVIHVRNAPSPAATSSLALAKMVADDVDAKFCFASS